jgi:hypothetical protein
MESTLTLENNSHVENIKLFNKILFVFDTYTTYRYQIFDVLEAVIFSAFSMPFNSCNSEVRQ